MKSRWTILWCAAATRLAFGQASQPAGAVEIDECGTLKQAAGCVVFSAAGGDFVLSDYGGFRAGDAVRVVGTADPDCTQICAAADGCVRGAKVYDPAQFPCGTPIPSLEDDLAGALTGALCTAAGAALPVLAIAGLWLARRQASAA